MKRENYMQKKHRKQELSYFPDTEKQAHEDAAAYAREIAVEGIVLLKNEGNLLPLAKGTHLNLFGLRCVEMNYNGGGSATSDESKCITLEKALRQAGFLLNQDLLNISYNYLKNGKYSVASLGENYEVKSRNKQKSGAVFVPKPGSPVKSEIPKDLRLTESEKQLLKLVCGQFSRVILILNTANVMEMGRLSDYPSIKSVLWVGFPGTSGNLALGDILNGTVNTSGRLPDT